jgi:hypothetical protein
MHQLVYIEHLAGEYVDGIQVCRHCGTVLCNDTSLMKLNVDQIPPQGFPPGPLYVCAGMSMTVRPERSYGPDDMYERTVKPCVENKNTAS